MRENARGAFYGATPSMFKRFKGRLKKINDNEKGLRFAQSRSSRLILIKHPLIAQCRRISQGVRAKHGNSQKFSGSDIRLFVPANAPCVSSDYELFVWEARRADILTPSTQPRAIPHSQFR